MDSKDNDYESMFIVKVVQKIKTKQSIIQVHDTSQKISSNVKHNRVTTLTKGAEVMTYMPQVNE